MDKSSESSSDSDSNSSTSWVFIDDTTISLQQVANTFHLDCSREPIQELTEQDLLSVSSDIESDTDGISVISESEMPIDDPCLHSLPFSCNNDGNFKPQDETNVVHNDNDELMTSETTVISEENENLTRNCLTNIFKPLHMLGLGVVLTAVFLASYSQIVMKANERNGDNFNVVDDVALYDEIELKPHGDLNKKLYDAKNHLDKELAQIVDITISCTHGNKPRNNIKDKEIKKCVKKHYRTKKDGITHEGDSKWMEKPKRIVHGKSKESSADFYGNVKNLYENYEGRKQKYNKIPKKIAYDAVEEISVNFNEIVAESFNMDVKQKYNKKENKATYCNKNKNDDLFCKTETEDRASYIENKKEKFDKNGDTEKVGIKLTYNKNKYDSKEKFKDYDKHDTRFENRERRRKNQNHIPTKKPNKYEKEKKQYDYKNKKFTSSKEVKFIHKSNNKFNKFEGSFRTFVNFNDKNNKYKENVSNKSSKFEEEVPTFKLADRVNLNFASQQKQNSSTSGEWYTNLHKARNQIRKQEHVSDWVFDRAHSRNKKRNKAQWYFKWMHLREQLRYKQSYRPYSS